MSRSGLFNFCYIMQMKLQLFKLLLCTYFAPHYSF
jgi:hypothetical protein